MTDRPPAIPSRCATMGYSPVRPRSAPSTLPSNRMAWLSAESLALVGGALVVAVGYAAPPNPEVVALRIDHPDAHWSSEGYEELVPPIRLPTTKDGLDETTVWLQLPGHATIATRWLGDQQRHVHSFPAGTRADRVERHGVRTEHGV